jgi:hypothetical protein
VLACLRLQLLVVAAIAFTLIFMYIINSLLKQQQRLREAEGHFFAPGDFQIDDKLFFRCVSAAASACHICAITLQNPWDIPALGHSGWRRRHRWWTCQ